MQYLESLQVVYPKFIRGLGFNVQLLWNFRLTFTTRVYTALNMRMEIF